MHIEPGVVDGAKIILSYATAAGAFGLAARMARQTIRQDGGTAALALRSVATTALVFSFFEVLPHYPVGVSEVHLILGSTLFLIFGRSEEHTSELQSLMRISYAVFCLKKKIKTTYIIRL